MIILLICLVVKSSGVSPNNLSAFFSPCLKIKLSPAFECWALVSESSKEAWGWHGLTCHYHLTNGCLTRQQELLKRKKTLWGTHSPLLNTMARVSQTSEFATTTKKAKWRKGWKTSLKIRTNLSYCLTWVSGAFLPLPSRSPARLINRNQLWSVPSCFCVFFPNKVRKMSSCLWACKLCNPIG